ncbi:MAG TPA: GspE/PulE family protein [bacterium]|nr:type II/IV secretion system protein [Candidatus Omnitrophota bacterium]HOJ58688.1 GspE/PulE family protein [bacterium]HOL93633.1 GspE/PulE family protein [bacterium]HPP00104.1 GspE/PulE family protein [bacterium]
MNDVSGPDNGKTSQYALESESAQRLQDVDFATVEVGPEDMLAALAEQANMEIVQLRKKRLLPEVVSLLPEKMARRNNAIVIDQNDGGLVIAVSDPFNLAAQDAVRFCFQNKHIQWVLAREDDIQMAIERYYKGEQAMVEDMLTEISENQEYGTDKDTRTLKQMLTEDISVDEEGPIMRLVDLIFEEAVRMRASDIHFEPFEDKFIIRFRIDGVLHEIQSPSKKLQGPILSRLKLMSGMDLSEKRVPQDGRIQKIILGRHFDFRVSALPALHGESIVTRLLEQSGVLLGLEQIGFLEDNIEKFKKMIRRPNGIILMTGPTGSGKTTTLYSALNVINTVDTKIVTVENPVEYQIEGINQVQINDDIGLTFSLALRSILRQAPNVILVGEIRDLETAEIAVSAAMTGHLVFSTLHTNDAPGANTRLVEMGVKPFLVASAIQAVIAQRLVRTICPDCKEPYQADPLVIKDLGFDPEEYKDHTFYRGRGCETCNYTGYKGRTAIHEVMENSDEIRDLVLKNASTDQIRAMARKQGMRTLREDGWLKVLRGTTTMVEVARITAGDEI